MSETLPQGWESVKLSEIANKIVDGSHNPPPKSESGLPMLSARNINEFGEIVFDDYRLIEPSHFEYENRRTHITSSDVLLTTVGAIGRSAVVTSAHGNFTLQRSVSVIKPCIAIDAYFLHYQFTSPECQYFLDKNANGTAQRGIYLKTLGTMPIILPPLAEQQRIVAKLEALLTRSTNARNELAAIPKLIERYKQAVLAAAFRGDLTTDWRKKHEINKNSWTTGTVRDFFKLIDGDRGKNYPKKHDYLEQGFCLFLSTKNVRPNGFLFDETVFISEKNHRAMRSGTLELGDLVLTTRGTLGNVAIFNDSVDFKIARINSGMLIFRSVSKNLNTLYAFYYLMSPLFQKQIEEFKTGSAQPQLPSGIIKNFSFEYPSIEEQLEIISQISFSLKTIDTIEAELTQAEALRKRLEQATLSKAFRGELVPQNPNDEPASVLLKRIRAEHETQPKVKRIQRIKPIKKIRSTQDEPTVMVERSNLLNVIKGAGKPVTPEELLRGSIYNEDTIEDFYAALKLAVESKQIVEDREGDKILLRSSS